ncbi:MAG: anthranilate synthase [Hyphomicrobiales bacterium]|nr:anthranilate synthase [Hyphomicrobiales bacterium]
MASVDKNYVTDGGVEISRHSVSVDYETAIDSILDRVDQSRGAVLSSNYEYPGRYTRWDTAIVDPPLGIEGRGRKVEIIAYNARGRILLPGIYAFINRHEHLASCDCFDDRIILEIVPRVPVVREEERSRSPTVFSVVRAIVDLFRSDGDESLGLYGAFGYDLAFQFDKIDFKMPRPESQRDLVLYLPDEILIVDHHRAMAWHQRYEYKIDRATTRGIERTGSHAPFAGGDVIPPRGDHNPGEYAKNVEKAKHKFRCGDLFEVVPGQMFFERCTTSPSKISRKLKAMNPSPYSFYFNLGDNEFLVGASPEMFVRVTGRRIETCPISGTIKRGQDAIDDAEQIIKLLNSKKDEAELTMCSDVDRNDKSRVCEPGSVRVIGRRQIEMYSKLIHTVDHIEGRLRENMDALDGFLSHAWAVTVTGAPKLWAMRYIEENEKSPRVWYGGAVGAVGFNGDMNTGLTLRTIRIKDGIAEVRAGATLLNDSNPDEEEAETELKASAMLAAVREAGKTNEMGVVRDVARVGLGKRILLVDHEDSFVHTLANYFRQTGAEVTTLRSPIADNLLDEMQPDLVVLSPGPGTPSDFDCVSTIAKVRTRKIPLFGVCLGLQAIAVAFGGELRQLDIPMHGKPSRISVEEPGIVFSGLDDQVTVGRYHSLCADSDKLPGEFMVTARSDDGVVMGIEHRSEPVAAVQFHPESIMSLSADAGMRMIENVVAHMANTKGSSVLPG